VTTPAYSPIIHCFDVLILGAGGAGLRAAIEAAKHGVTVGVITKVPPTRSHTVAAQGGINAALGNVTADDWRWHAYDTIRGSDWLGDQDAIRYMCKHAAEAIHDLEAMGVPFTRDEEGKIYQRPYGGMSTHYGKGDLAFRACAAADRTGDAMMTGLYQYVQRFPVTFFEEFIVLDLLMEEDGRCRGCVAWELASGDLHVFLAPHTILATGGYGQIFASATSSSTCTGDGNAFVLRAGLPCMDMEFIQFHPTGLYGSGVLISEAARAEGGILCNSLGEAFMARYAPKYKDLASRDVVTRCIMQEIREGRGCGAKGDYIHLNLTGIDPERIATYLPGTESLARELVGIDIRYAPIPVVPTAHYTMGGVPVNLDGQVLDHAGDVVEGLYCIGEAACNSIHGANRLGCNSLLDLVVFGKRAGEVAAKNICHPERSEGSFHHKQGSFATLRMTANFPHRSYDHILARFDGLRHAKGDADPYAFCRASQQLTQSHAGILRDASSLQAGITELERLRERFATSCRLYHQDLRWNNGLVTALETENLMMQSLVVLHSALFRNESRGAHMRTDYPERNDEAWLQHTLAGIDGYGQVTCTVRAVRMDASEGEASLLPEARVY
jgi:succinate dehydrogenase / fumarate reductase, flavoprotein subunit